MLLGQLGYKPWELHRITFREVHLAIQGLYEQNKYLHDLFYRSTMLICSSGFNAKYALSKISKVWPLPGKKAPVISERAKEQLRQLREAEAWKSANKKLNAGRT